MSNCLWCGTPTNNPHHFCSDECYDEHVIMDSCEVMYLGDEPGEASGECGRERYYEQEDLDPYYETLQSESDLWHEM